ncbi:cob(I)yrinic acid a,c-diamide adenosyltransferase [Candidatus Woesearchaeota archaeon]|nr:cob(I)yrinic acid a,c-diamide adenosyltransferase [Candidatus Woesearchaeota archaeon]
MPYYTKAGDMGRTCILGAGRLAKDDLLVEALGCFDELSCALGVAASFSSHRATASTLYHLQNDLHTVCAELSSGGSEKFPLIREEHLAELELAVARIEGIIGPQSSFLLPGGSRLASLIHLARAVARRAERTLVRLSKARPVRSELLVYANRLSTLLYVLARLQNRMQGFSEAQPRYRYQK